MEVQVQQKNISLDFDFNTVNELAKNAHIALAEKVQERSRDLYEGTSKAVKNVSQQAITFIQQIPQGLIAWIPTLFRSSDEERRRRSRDRWKRRKEGFKGYI